MRLRKKPTKPKEEDYYIHTMHHHIYLEDFLHQIEFNGFKVNGSSGFERMIADINDKVMSLWESDIEDLRTNIDLSIKSAYDTCSEFIKDKEELNNIQDYIQDTDIQCVFENMLSRVDASHAGLFVMLVCDFDMGYKSFVDYIMDEGIFSFEYDGDDVYTINIYILNPYLYESKMKEYKEKLKAYKKWYKDNKEEIIAEEKRREQKKLEKKRTEKKVIKESLIKKKERLKKELERVESLIEE